MALPLSRLASAIIAAWVLFFVSSDPANAERKPNILFIISDDQGYSDFGFTGNPAIQTPVLDQLAAESAVFENFVVAAACSPSRAAFLTGREHLSTGVWGVPKRDNLHPDEALMPAWFKKAGYATFYAGKRDMGRPPYTTPWERGWDQGYFVSGYQHRNPRLHNRGDTIEPEGWTCDIMTDLILDFWKANTDLPKLAIAAYVIPHLPFVLDESFAQPYLDAGLSHEIALCYGSITQMDTAIGRLLEGLRANSEEEDTIVVFVSDNGMSTKATAKDGSRTEWTESDWKIRNHHGLSGAKAWAWENGIRVPCLIKWPGVITPGKRPQLGGAEDILPTLLDLSGIDPASVEHHPFAGVSLRPALEDPAAKFERPDLLRIAISGTGSARELAEGETRNFEDHHLVLRGPRFKYHALPGGESALYDLTADPGEIHDRQSEFPEVAAKMAKELRARWDALLATGRAFHLREDAPER
ncbi:MAG: sulfatase-like hydrolase/transferase [Verrucomicrobiota bacterium]